MLNYKAQSINKYDSFCNHAVLHTGGQWFKSSIAHHFSNLPHDQAKATTITSRLPLTSCFM